MKSAGTHLIIDGYVQDAKVFTLERLESLFHNLAKAMDMCILLGPVFVEVPLDESKLTGDKFRDEGGITGMCVISTSHISLHAWPLRRFFSMDVFSCCDFDTVKAMQIVRGTLSTANVNATNLNRVDPGHCEASHVV